MVQECCKYVDTLSDLTIKLRLIDTLRTVTAGKVLTDVGHMNNLEAYSCGLICIVLHSAA